MRESVYACAMICCLIGAVLRAGDSHGQDASALNTRRAPSPGLDGALAGAEPGGVKPGEGRPVRLSASEGLLMPQVDASNSIQAEPLQVDLLGLPELQEFSETESFVGEQPASPGLTISRDPSFPQGPESGLGNQRTLAVLESSAGGDAGSAPLVRHSVAEMLPGESMAVRTIPTYTRDPHGHRLVQYDVPLEDREAHVVFRQRGIEGRLMKVEADEPKDDSVGATLKRFWNPVRAQEKQKKVSVVRYEVPADDIDFHSQMIGLEGEILEPSMLRLPEVRFFQPKARIFSDLKRGNDDEFDLFSDGAILASLDVVELYFPMPLISERFAEAFGKSSRLSSLGWRVGGTLGMGITSALRNGDAENGSAPVSTLSAGVRYEFPLGRPSRELLDTGDIRLDQRTRVGIECGIQGGFSTRESLGDRTDVGMYFGILVNTPWGS